MQDLSSVQQAIWLTQKIYADSTLYNVGGYALIEGALDESLLIWCIEAVLSKADVIPISHHAFRDHLPTEQFAIDTCDIAAVDLSASSDASLSCLEWMSSDIQKGFDLTTCIVKVRVIRVGEDRWYWYTKAHHLVFDGYSMSLFFRTVSMHYSDLVSDAGPGSREELYKYADFIEDDRAYRLSAEFTADRAFWLQRLQGLSGAIAFQSCLRSTQADSLSSRRKERKIPRDLYDRIEVFCNDHHCTPFHYFIAVLLVLNKGYNNDTPVIGLPVFNRRTRKFKNTLGTCVNILPFSVDCQDDVLFLHLLYFIRDELKDCYRHQRFALYDLLQELDRAGNIYNITFSYQKNSYEANLGDLKTSISYLHSGQQQENLAFHLLDYMTADDLTLSVDYKETLFPDETIDALLDHFITLSVTLYRSPQLSVGLANYLKAGEREKLITGFNDTAADYFSHSTVVGLFQEQAARTPDAIALVFAGNRLTFREVNEWSNQLSDHLRTIYEIRPDDVVAILLPRSEWLVIAVMGVLKSGGAYLPIDPDLPEDRIRYMLSDSGSRALVDEDELNRFIRSSNKYSRKDLAPAAQPDDLAYVIYTSGSTGQPKGCMLEHRGLVNRLEWMWRQFDIDQSDSILQKTNYTFDVSVWEILLPLCLGAKMVVCPKEDARSPHGILSLIAKEGITCLHFVPGMLATFVTTLAGDPGILQQLRPLRRVITSGEVLSPAMVQGWYDNVSIPLYNLYGPTEASIDVSWYATSKQDRIVPIGRPIWNTQIYIIGKADRLLPIGAAGEICIGGIGLARGYLNKPELTADKFVPDPFRQWGRIYRTGDLGRWLPDGNIEYLGRNDGQVKIRGYRIEPGEIENILQGHPDIDAAVVVAVDGAGGGNEKELVAYIVSGSILHIPNIRAFAAQKLPAYMVPGKYIPLEALPLTSSGKVDRRKLPDPSQEGLSSGTDFIAPRNRTEKLLTVIWQDVLGRERVGVKDDFFTLGGHSLKVNRLVSRIHQVFDIKPDLSRFFTATTLEDQALLIAQAQTNVFLRIEKAGARSHYPLSASQRRLWVLSQFEDSHIAYNMEAAYRMKGPLDPAAMQHSFHALIARHEILRTVFKEDELGIPGQYILPPGPAGFSMDLRDLRREKEQASALQRLIEIAHTQPFDLGRGPLLRAGIYRLSDTDWTFSFTMHHIISDGWSMGILIDELLLLYNTFTAGGVADMAPLAIQYKDFTVWQQRQLKQDVLAVHKSYWLQQFEGELPVMDLSGYRPRPAEKSFRGGVVHKKIHAARLEDLTNCSRQQGGTLFMGLLATVNILLYKYTGQNDIILGSPAAGREHIDLEGQIGFYVNTLALRTRFNGSDSFCELVGNVRRQTLQAYEHQVYPFDALVDELNLPRDTGRNPLFDILVVIQNEEDQPLERIHLRDITVTPYKEVTGTIIKFDLTYYFTTSAEGLGMTIEYNSDLYDSCYVERMAGHFNNLLGEVLGHPDIPIDGLQYLDPAEKNLLLETFNNTDILYPANKTITSLFEACAAASPDRAAILFEDKVISYQELNERSNQLGNYLRKNFGMGANDLAGIKLERSERLIISIMGVLKSGGAYVPIDPDYPQERIDHMLDDSKCKVMIDDDILTAFEKEAWKYEKGDLQPLSGPEDLLYVIYTSGSTGRPKGAMVKHRSFVNLAAWYGRLTEMEEKDVVLLMAPVSFDLAQKNIFTTLIRGAALCLPVKLYGDYSLLANTIRQKKVTIVNAAPSAFYPLLDKTLNDGFTMLSSLKKIILGGEPIVVKEFLEWVRSGYYHGELVNSYGPTECTDVVAAYTVDNSGWKGLQDIPIGKPAANCRLYILDRAGGLTPVGVPGEIFIGGVCVGTGYLGQPELTREKFIADPFREDQLMYRTGDVGQWLLDGNVRYIGRKDNQVKVRGYRIEPGEIERVLLGHQEIDSAVVVARAQADGDKQLVAYIVGGGSIPLTTLRAYLGKHLPAYMIPDHFVILEKLPLTPSGKLDRNRLPLPAAASITGNEAYVAPRNATETQLVLIWQEILGIEKIGVKDDFFQLGGQSLKAVQLISRINKHFSVRINIRDMFKEATIENIGEHIVFVAEQNRMKKNKESLIQIDI